MSRQTRNRKDGGSVYQRKDGRWTASLKIDGTTRYRYARKGANTRTEANRLLRALLVERETGTYVPPNKQTVRQYLEGWLEPATAELSYSTQRNYRTSIGRACTEIGDLKLSTLTTEHLDELYASLKRATYSPGTIQQTHVVLKMALKSAVQRRHLLRNPADFAHVPRSAKEEIHPFSRDELQLILDLAFDAEPRWAPLLDLLATTGLRVSEALGLEWSKINWETREITVSEQLQYFPGEDVRFRLMPLKTKRSRRTVPLSRGTAERLRSHRTRQQREWLECAGEKVKSELVFSCANGRPVQASLVWSALHRLCLIADVEPRRTHDLRHTAATHMLDRLPIHVVSRILGHASPSTTLNIYAHVLKGADRGAADMWDELLVRG